MPGPEIFISYAHVDDDGYDRNTAEVSHPITHFIEMYRSVTRMPRDRVEEFFFLDRSSIEPGRVISRSIEHAIVDCSIMIAFYSPRYFDSPICLEEWKAFREQQTLVGEDDEGNEQKIIFPVEVEPVDRNAIAGSDAAIDEWYSDLVGANGRKRAIDSTALLDNNDTTRLNEQIRALAKAIDAHLDRRSGTSPERRSAPNVLSVNAPIRGGTFGRQISAEILASQSKLRYNKKPPVGVIYAGGTVGMVQRADSDSLHADYEMAKGVDTIVEYLAPNIASLRFDVHFFRLSSAIDSSNVRAQDWVTLAELVHEQIQNYQGIVILHGTNTLAYTASALSFLLSNSLTRPVVLTGSEVPLSNRNTDAIHNVENAIRATAHMSYGGPVCIPEVCVYWNNHLYRGNRVTKKAASDRSSSFHTPNMAVPLATLANDKLDVEFRQIIPEREPSANGSRRRRVRNISDVDVAILFIHPNMDFEQIDAVYERCPDGLILLSYGPGNVPEDETFIAMIERLLAGGTIVANVTQCPYGRVELKLFETSATLFDLGVVDGYDMTLEAAYTKLMWAIASIARTDRRQVGERESIKATFQENVAGEMSASVFTVHWPWNKFTTLGGTPYLVSDVGDFRSRFSRFDIAEAFIRIEGLRFPDGVKEAKVAIFYGAPPEEGDESEWDNMLAGFDKTLTPEELRRKSADKNLEITHEFRRCFDARDFQISIGTTEGTRLAFKSVRLVVYTKGTRHT